MLEFLQQIDERLLLFLNSKHSPLFDNLMYWASGNFSWTPLYVILLGLIIYYKGKKTLLIFPLIVLLITLSDQSSVHLFKNVFMRLRPCHNPDIQEYIHLVRDHCGGKYGFVSSHATNTFAFAVFLKHVFRKRWLTIILFFWAVLVSYSRIYLGVHYPFDVLGGALWGALLGYFVYLLGQWLDGVFFKEEKATKSA